MSKKKITKAMRVFLKDQRNEVRKEDRMAARQDKQERKSAAPIRKRKRK